jgi:hypothetical protein
MKKINELNNPSNTKPTIEEQVAFIEELTRRSQERQKILKQQLSDLKIELGIHDEN